MATGMCFLETAANPYVTALGTHDTASRRLNLAQSFNGLGAFISAMFLSKLILTGQNYTRETLPADFPGVGRIYPDGDRLHEDALSGSCRVTHHSCSSVYTV